MTRFPADTWQALAYVYARATNVEAAQAKVLTADEARLIADHIAKMPSLLKRDDCPVVWVDSDLRFVIFYIGWG